MKSAGVTSKGSSRRGYSSPLREKQALATRRLILEGLLDQLADGGLRDFSIPHVAKRAGVTARTVYRYFPTREALLEAVDAEMDARFGQAMSAAMTADELVASVKPQFAAFTEHGTLVHALLKAGLGGEIRARGRRRRAVRLRAALAEELPGMPPEELHRASALLHYLYSVNAWDSLQGVWGLSEQEAADVVTWGISTLVDDLRRRARKDGGTARPTRARTGRRGR